MVNINIEISEELHKKIKLSSVIKEMTLKDYVIKVLEKKSRDLKSR